MEPLYFALAVAIGCYVLVKSVWPTTISILNGIGHLLKWLKNCMARPANWLHAHMPKNKVGRFIVKAILAVIAYPVMPSAAAINVAMEDPTKAPMVAAIHLIGFLVFGLWYFYSKRTGK